MHTIRYLPTAIAAAGLLLASGQASAHMESIGDLAATGDNALLTEIKGVLGSGTESGGDGHGWSFTVGDDVGSATVSVDPFDVPGLFGFEKLDITLIDPMHNVVASGSALGGWSYTIDSFVSGGMDHYMIQYDAKTASDVFAGIFSVAVAGAVPGAVPTPLPAAAWMFAAGLAGLAATARRRRRNAAEPVAA